VGDAEDRFPTHEERLQAFYDGTASYCTPEVKHMWTMVQELTSYWPEGAMGMAYADQVPFFLQGKAAMFMLWMGALRQLDVAVNEGTIDWEYGTFGWPSVTSESNPFPMDKPNPIDGGWNGWWTIPSDRAGTKELELVVDFLQWWTSEDFSGWYAYRTYCLPANIHAQGNPKCMAFYKGDPHQRRGLTYLDKFKWFGYFQSWILGDITYEDYCMNVDEVNRLEAERLAGEIGLVLSEVSPW
jgi:ABC-type glycerol-3-phosphate transport system substrate-binding protein